MKWAINIQVCYFIITYVWSQEVKYSAVSKLFKNYKKRIIKKIPFFLSMLLKHVSLHVNYGFAGLLISLIFLHDIMASM